MSIAGCSQSIKELLENRLREDGGLGDYSVSIFSTRELTSGFENQIGIVLYRIEIDPNRRHVSLPRATPLAPGRIAVALELRYLLVVWGKNSALGEQVMLGRCIDILDQHAVIAGPLLSEAYPWEPGDAIKLTIEPLATDELMRVWDATNANYQISVGYVARTIHLAPRSESDAPMADSRTLVFAPGLPA